MLDLHRLGSVPAAALVGLPYGVSVEVVGRGTDTTLQRYVPQPLEGAVAECNVKHPIRARHRSVCARSSRTTPHGPVRTPLSPAPVAPDTPAVVTNKDLVDNNQAQAMAAEDIARLKQTGASGEVRGRVCGRCPGGGGAPRHSV